MTLHVAGGGEVLGAALATDDAFEAVVPEARQIAEDARDEDEEDCRAGERGTDHLDTGNRRIGQLDLHTHIHARMHASTHAHNT